jgi:hypothetical protein
MSYNYTDGDGLAALVKTEPANSDSVALSCAQAIRQIKAFIRDTTANVGLANLFTRVTAAEASITSLSASASVAGRDLFRAKPTSNIDVVHGGAGSITTDLSLGTEVFDLDSRFAANIFTAPSDGYYRFDAAITLFNQSGSPTYITADAFIIPSVGPSIKLSNPPDDESPNQRSLSGGGVCQLSAGQTVKLSITTEVDAAATVRIAEIYTFLTGYRVR